MKPATRYRGAVALPPAEPRSMAEALLVHRRRVRYTSGTMRGHPCASKSQRIEKGPLWEGPFMLPSTVQAPADNPCDESCDDLSRNGCHPRDHNGPPYYPPICGIRGTTAAALLFCNIPQHDHKGPVIRPFSIFTETRPFGAFFHARKEGTQ